MADYIYLLENRLSPAQKQALQTVRTLARAKGFTVFLVGGAVRDLTSGSPVGDLDVVVQGNALKLRKELELAGAKIMGDHEPTHALFARFPGGARMEIGGTLTVAYPKPGKPIYKTGTILDDLRRRDFTANAMALSLNEGSYGLLMDPLNGVADIENRQLRLGSNYGFIEDPVRMIRAARLIARLGWTLEEKTQTRYETGKAEGYISAMSEFHRGYELEEIVHEEDPLRVLRALEAEGWLQALAPFWTAAKANVAELERLREVQTQLQMQVIHPDAATAHFPLLTAKLTPKEIAELKKSFPRPGFVAEIDALEAEAKDFAAQLGGKHAASPSQAWKTIVGASPEAVLWTAYSTKNAGLQAKFKSFFAEWPLVRQKIPYAQMQEMRITADLPGFAELVEKLFFELMDGHLSTTEELKAYLEPYSPPAPPPPTTLRRARASKKEVKPKRGKKALVAKLDDIDDDAADVDLDGADLDEGGDEDVEAIELPTISDDDLEIDIGAIGDDEGDDSDSDETEELKAPVNGKAPVKPQAIKAKAAKAVKPAAPAPVAPIKKAAVKAAVKMPTKSVVKAAAKKAAKAPAKSAPVRSVFSTKPKVAPASKRVISPKVVAKKVVAAKKAVVTKKVVAPKKAQVKKAVTAKGKTVVKAVAKPAARLKVSASAKKPTANAKPTSKPMPVSKGKRR